MSFAFDTIKTEHLLDIVNRIVNDDVTRMIQTLISKTILEIKSDGDVEKVPFETNIGSSQGYGVSGTAFDCYFEDALVDVREKNQGTNRWKTRPHALQSI